MVNGLVYNTRNQILAMYIRGLQNILFSTCRPAEMPFINISICGDFTIKYTKDQTYVFKKNLLTSKKYKFSFR